MTAPPIVGTFATEAARKAAFAQAVKQEQANSDTATRNMLAPQPPIMREIMVQAQRSPIIIIGILILGYLLVTVKGGTKDWE